MMWWNRRDFVKHEAPEQVSKILTETERLTESYTAAVRSMPAFPVDCDRTIQHG
jgi:hypothetical protein